MNERRSRLPASVRRQALRLLPLCWLVYAAAYLARASVSSGFAQLAGHFGVDGAYLGALGSVFFICYALGQLVNGYLGDHLAPHRFVLVSMLGSAAVYTLALLLDSARALVALWGLNGFFLSMLWGPMLRLICLRLGQERRASFAMLMGAAPVGGYFLSWLVLAPRMPRLGWRAVFGAPLLMTGILLVCWVLTFRRAAPAPEAAWASKRRGLRETFAYVRKNRLWGIAFTSVCLGLVKENLALLMPTLFAGFMGSQASDLSVWQLALLPAGNLLGLLCGRLLAGPLMARPARGLLFTFLGMALACGALSLCLSLPGAAFAALFVLVALSYLGSCILISYIPLAHAGENMVSTLVGLFDFGNYLGAALSGVLLGALLADGQWALTAFIWMGFCLLAAGMAILNLPPKIAVFPNETAAGANGAPQEGTASCKAHKRA